MNELSEEYTVEGPGYLVEGLESFDNSSLSDLVSKYADNTGNTEGLTDRSDLL